ncbi:MAG TPA: hypothetical protein DCQ98_10015 [Planctomycetaceae bacterium]|nr:hypothetical protein [Planctomycetaceae bacterium]HRF00502.1 flagellar basal body P-ring protein FlgI [Pirellulaceae bacterium]
MNACCLKTGSLLLLIAIAMMVPGRAAGQIPIRRVADVKGQESSVLRGVGIVVGLKGTGDPDLAATYRALGRMLSGSGLEMMRDVSGQELISEFRGTSNAAIVFVTAEVPGSGLRQGSKVRCRVDSFGSAVSLQGGMLLEASLTGGPYVGDSGKMPILAIASGPIELIDQTHATSGVVDRGCQLQVDFRNTFTYVESWVPRRLDQREFVPDEGGMQIREEAVEPKQQLYFDLVIRPQYAGFGTASEVAETLKQYQPYLESSGPMPLAKDQVTIQVPIPDYYVDDPVNFVSELLALELHNKPKKSVVVINRRTGIVIIGDEVRFDPAAVSSADFAIDAGATRPLDLDANGPLPPGPGVELKRLQQALDQLQAPPETLIEIVKGLAEGGYLYGEVIEID